MIERLKLLWRTDMVQTITETESIFWLTCRQDNRLAQWRRERRPADESELSEVMSFYFVGDFATEIVEAVPRITGSFSVFSDVDAATRELERLDRSTGPRQLQYAKVGGPPQDWQHWFVVDLSTGRTVRNVVEVNTAVGYVVVLTGKPDPFDPRLAGRKRIEGRFELRRVKVNGNG